MLVLPLLHAVGYFCPVAMTTIIIPRSSYMLAHHKNHPLSHSTCFTAPAAHLSLQSTPGQRGFAFLAIFGFPFVPIFC